MSTFFPTSLQMCVWGEGRALSAHSAPHVFARHPTFLPEPAFRIYPIPALALLCTRLYSYSRSSLFRVMAWAARARGPCCVKWYPKRTIEGHCSSTVAISISTASPGHWRWRRKGGSYQMCMVFTTPVHGPLGS